MQHKITDILNVLWYVLVFLIIQYVVMLGGCSVWLMSKGYSAGNALRSALMGETINDGMTLAIVLAVTSIITIAVFVLWHWSPLSQRFLRSRPWTALLWVALLTCGTVIPSVWMLEQLHADMPEYMQQLFLQIMREPWGYLALGILAPVAEEMVFRGAVLRTLLNIFSREWHWMAILLSALLFGAVHGNVPQFLHAALTGLLLGWLYYRTDSIVPGIVLHWVNNTIAYVGYNLYPQSADQPLIDLFGGSQQRVWAALGFSLCIFLPSLFQVNRRLKKG